MTTDRNQEGLPGTIPWRSGTLYVILSSSLMGVMGVSLISPVLPGLRSVFGITDAQVGLIITVYTLPGVFLTPVIGLVADRVGRRRTIVPLLFVFGVAGAAIAFVTAFTHVLVLRFLQGVGASALVTLAVTLVGDSYAGDRRDAVMGLNGSMIGTGAAFYPFLGGLLAAVRWNVPFLFFGISVPIGLFAFAVLDEPANPDAMGTREYLDRLQTVARLPRAIAVFVAVFAAFFVFYGGVLTAVPLLLSDEFGLTAARIGPVLAMVSLASAVVSSQYGRASEWRESPELIALGFVAYGAGLLLVRAAPSPLFVAGALLVFGVGFGLALPSIDTTVVTLVSDDLRAGMMGMRTSLLRTGQTLGPVGFTFAAEAFFPTTVEGYRFLLVTTGTIVIVAGSLAYAFLRRRRE